MQERLLIVHAHQIWHACDRQHAGYELIRKMIDRSLDRVAISKALLAEQPPDPENRKRTAGTNPT